MAFHTPSMHDVYFPVTQLGRLDNSVKFHSEGKQSYYFAARVAVRKSKHTVADNSTNAVTNSRWCTAAAGWKRPVLVPENKFGLLCKKGDENYSVSYILEDDLTPDIITSGSIPSCFYSMLVSAFETQVVLSKQVSTL